ncbi:MFS transporter [Phytohalomonas tamaricis]|uniref:MFS transporter n=1 Tax=Phytohalomonas tamaricis TaxID=2081032 RepID=UPI000D0B91CB|nr:MFS transporter [Phytohalomonas tamaricis]
MSGETYVNQDQSKQIVLGMPVVLFWGYIAIAFFMTGDGIEQAFLAKYIVDIGFTPGQASMVFTVYGAAAALSSWLSGVLSEVYGPRRIMSIGVVMWLVLHAAFLHWGLGIGNYPMMLLFYGLRGFAYPLFFYAFFVWVVQKTPDNRLASATGWIWAMFTIGYGIMASYLPSWTIPAIGFMGTLWMSMIWVLAGGVMALWFVKDTPSEAERAIAKSAPTSDKMREISRGMTLIFENKYMFRALIIRIICNLSLFGFPVIMPLFYTSDHVGFTTTEWLRIWGTFFVIQPLTNVMWGIIGDRIGWMRQMRWIGFVGCGTATLLFYYLPYYIPNNFPIAILVALLFALTVTSFVPMGAIFPMIEPNHKGAAISIQNLGGGLSNFFGPAIATVLLSIGNVAWVVIVYGALYFFAAVLTLFIHVDQPRGKSARNFTAH